MTKQMENFERWLEEPKLAPELRQELVLLKEQGEAGLSEIEDRFYRDLEFGTGGLRGVLGAGTNRMNVHVVARTVQGLADYVLENAGDSNRRDQGKKPSVAISFDSRIKSDVFSKIAAEVLLANGIDVYLFQELMPTPALSFATRHYKCDAGIMITASHNPSKYNGLKVYNKDGCQETLIAAERIMEKIEKLDAFDDIKNKGEETGTLTFIPEETVSAYIDAVTKEQIQVDCGLDKVHVVFTPLNGTGNKPIRSMLDKIGTGKITVVKEQENPDGNFTTCPYPNPEKEEALKLGKALFMELFNGADKPEDRPDVLLASDPDADRIGVACFKEGGAKTFSGNEIGVLIFDFICNHKILPENPVAIRTIVSTKMVDAIAKKFGVQMIATLTGFKFIGEQIGHLEEKGEEDRFVFGFEESVGYLSGAYVRDKDAINAAMLVTQMVGYYKKQGITMFERLEELYLEYGYWQNGLIEFAFEGAKGMETMAAIMDHFRMEHFEGFAGLQIVEIINYKNQTRRIVKGDNCCSMVSGTRPTNLPSSDVMEFVLENGSGFALRPSGTEPKFKIYMGATGVDHRESEGIIEKLTRELTEIINMIRE